jgi:hypothetical protein
MKIHIRYCGGCNPEYDRVAAVGLLAESGFKETAQCTDACLCIAVNGCGRRCASRNSALDAEVWSAGQMKELIAELMQK